MIFAQTQGNRRTVGNILSSTADTTIIADVPAGQRTTLESLMVSCDGTTTAFSLWVDTGSTDFYIYNAKSISSNDVLKLENHHVSLRPGWSLKCKASIASHLMVTTVVIEDNSNRGANGQ
jgi:hypothetical protein